MSLMSICEYRVHFGKSYGRCCTAGTRPLPPMSSAEALLLGLHEQLRRLLASHAGCHCQGIHQASRRRRGLTPSQMKRIRNIELAFHVIRHITAPFVSDFIDEVSTQLVPEFVGGPTFEWRWRRPPGTLCGRERRLRRRAWAAPGGCCHAPRRSPAPCRCRALL